jgi:HK97 family phage major capsid protein
MVPPVFAEALIGSLYSDNPVAARCTRWDSDQPLAEVRVPAIDETSRADGSRWGGALSYWAAEGATLTGSLPRFRNLSFSPKKLIAVVTGTGELMADSPMFDSAIRTIFGLEMGFRLDQAIVAGTGAGQPLGVLNSGALISVAEEASQTAGTIVAANVLNMWRRLPAPSRRNAVWLVHEDAEEQLARLDEVIAGTGVYNPIIYTPAGVGGSEYGRLLGRPIIAIEQCSQLGTVGDIILADLAQYIVIGGALTPGLSADVRFTSDEIVWRFVWRVDGQSAFASAVTPYTGSNSRSPFVALAARP